MQLTINNQLCVFMPLPAFIARWRLPQSFKVAYFEPKNQAGLASLDRARPALAAIKRQVLQGIDALPPQTNPMAAVERLTQIFKTELTGSNAQIGLREAELDFAVSGFYDLLQAVAYQLFQRRYGQRHQLAQMCDEFDFEAIYQSWLDDSARLSGVAHSFMHGGVHFEVRVVYNVYGRVGLAVTAAGEQFYVADANLACPAAKFMHDLCRDVALALCRSMSL